MKLAKNIKLDFYAKPFLYNIILSNTYVISVFNTWFSFSSDQHNCGNSSFTQRNFIKLFYKTNKYWKNSVTVSAVELWSKI